MGWYPEDSVKRLTAVDQVKRAIRYFDPDHSQNEDWFIMLGMLL